jgi:hypothetical protein
MKKDHVSNAGDALAYLIDCTLATVCELAMKKSRSQYEFARQKAIAQSAIDWAIRFGVGLVGTRAIDVMDHGSVDKWASKFDVRGQS